MPKRRFNRFASRGDFWGSTMERMSDLSGLLEEAEPLTVENGPDLTADPIDECFGTIRSDIVGVQYYHGVVSNNEMVNLVREPHNKYDRNAVRVDNVTNEQVGHIKREHAKALTAVVDSGLAKIEGIIPFGANNKFRIPVNVSVWGVPEKKAQALAVLKSHYVIVEQISASSVKRASGGAGFGLGSPFAGQLQADYSHVVSQRTFVSPKEMENAMDQMFETLDEGDKTTEAEPVQAIRTGLYPHQKQALNWMVCRENKGLLPPFWEKKGDLYINTLTICHTRTKPASVCGGILADDMGLGKTLQVISLILTNFVDGKPLAQPVSGTRRCPMAPTGKSSKKVSVGKICGSTTSSTPCGSSLPECSKTQQLESKTPQLESKTPQLESKTPQLESKTQQLESKTPQLESKTQQLESKTPQLESKTPQLESKTPQLESKTQQLESKTPQLESKTQQLESKTQQLESKTQQLESKTPQLESKTPQLESKTPQLESKVPTPQLESKIPQLESKTPQLESKPPQLESKPPQLESKPPQLESKIPQLETKTPQLGSCSPSPGLCSFLASIAPKPKFDAKPPKTMQAGEANDPPSYQVKMSGTTPTAGANRSTKEIHKEDPDFVPHDLKNSLPAVTPVGRSRRERKRPARYCYSDDEDNDEDGVEKSKLKKAKSKGKAAGKTCKSSSTLSNSNSTDHSIGDQAQTTLVQAGTPVPAPALLQVPPAVCEEVKENTDPSQSQVAAQLYSIPDNLSSSLSAELQGTQASNTVCNVEQKDLSTLPSSFLPTERTSPDSENGNETQTPSLPTVEGSTQKSAEGCVSDTKSNDVVVVEAFEPPVKKHFSCEDVIIIDDSEEIVVSVAEEKPKATTVSAVDVPGSAVHKTPPSVAANFPKMCSFPEDILRSKVFSACGIVSPPTGFLADSSASKTPQLLNCLKASSVPAKTLPRDLTELAKQPVKEISKISASPGKKWTTDAPVLQKTVVIDLDDELPDIPPVLQAKPVLSPVKLDSSYDAMTGRAKTVGPRGTLIICPLSVISNWVSQFEEHLDERVHISLYVYYGGARKKDISMLQDQDVVISTYSTLAADFKNAKQSPLHKVEWLRLVLDEGHIIRNPASQQAKAVYQVKARRKWAITGTPIQNSMKDLWSLINFLGVKPFTERSWWTRTIARPLAQRESKAIHRVSHLMRNLALRRTKNQQLNGRPLVALPPRHVFLEKIVFGEEERAVYEAMETSGRIIIGRYFRQGTLLHHYGEVLAILTRLRQLCCHPRLVASAVNKRLEDNPGAAIDEAYEAPAEAAPQPAAPPEGAGAALPEEERQRLIDQLLYVLDSGSDQECAICLESLRRGVITACAHVYCRPCIEAVIDNEQPNPKCPLCRAEINKEKLIEAPAEEARRSKAGRGEGEGGDSALASQDEGDGEERNWPTPAPWQSSAKIDALMKGLTEVRDKDPKTKSIVVSQFTSLLDLIEIPLSLQGFHFARLDGRMSAADRVRAVEEFSAETCGAPTVFLLSLKAGGVGINLTAATRVFLMDPAWNPAAEEQCFDRCHRLGQTKEVIITRFVIEDSVEERMLDLQEKKRQLMKGAFGRTQTREERRNNLVSMIRNLIRI